MSVGEDAVVPEDVPGRTAIVWKFVRRELSTAVVRPVYVGLWLVLVGVLLFIAWSGGSFGGGYVSAIVDLRTPLELLVPVLAFAYGYRAILNDDRRGELDVLRTYPVASWQVVTGIYVGRAIGLVVSITTALLIVMLGVALSGTADQLLYATYTGADSPGLYLRFLSLTVAFGLVILAVAVAISALVSTTRTAIAAVGIGLFVLLFGLDLALIFGVGRGVIPTDAIANTLALSPLSAYRGLVLETSIAVARTTGPAIASPAANLTGILAWWLGALALATVAVRR